jgi:hypothetical protein
MSYYIVQLSYLHVDQHAIRVCMCIYAIYFSSRIGRPGLLGSNLNTNLASESILWHLTVVSATETILVTIANTKNFFPHSIIQSSRENAGKKAREASSFELVSERLDDGFFSLTYAAQISVDPIF